MRFWRPRITCKALSATAVFTAALAMGPSPTLAQFPAAIDLSTLDGTNGFAINGIGVNELSGSSVSGAGDINGDGFDDLIIGGRNSVPNDYGSFFNYGESYLVFGDDGEFPASLELSALDGTNGFVINGRSQYGGSDSVSGAGDVNGDGIDDLIIGARSASGVGGRSYVVFGQTSEFSPSLDLSLLNGSDGFDLDGIDSLDSSGGSVSGAGDVNGDGLDDLIIGNNNGDPNGNLNAGESYVVFGNDGGFPSSLPLSTLDGTNGFVLNGIDNNDRSGTSVSGAGDVNGDGIDDLIIGARGGDPNGVDYAGESYVVFGNDSGFPSSLDLSTLNGSNGFVINGIDVQDRSSSTVSDAGDVNGDGIGDIIIGADMADPNGNSYAGESYVVFGNSSGFSPSLNLSALDGTNGFVINGVDPSDYSGTSVSGAGDVNGDGIDDLIIGAFKADPNGNSFAGATYVVFGNNSGFSSSLDLSTLDGTNGFVINGIDNSGRSGISVSGAGDVNGDGIDDLIIGAYRADPNGNRDAGESYVVFGRASVTNPLLGDANQDGVIDFLDIAPFISLLSSNGFLDEADINRDGVVDFLDIGPFIDVLGSQ